SCSGPRPRATPSARSCSKAAKAGEPFDTVTGRPVSQAKARNSITWYAHAQAYVEMKWPRMAAKSRRSIVEALTDVTLTLVRPDKGGRPDAEVLREAVYLYGLHPRERGGDAPKQHAVALAWLAEASLPMVDLESASTVRRVLDAFCMRQDSKPAAATTVQRK